ncbi:Uncharacterized protein ABC855_g3072 [[Candida] zeylanoides]
MDIHRARFVEYSPHTITAMAFSHPSSEQSAPPGLRLAVGRSNGDIEIWNPRHGWVHELTVYGARDRSIEGLCWAVDSDGAEPRLFSIGGSTAVTEWDLAALRPRANHDCNAGVVWSLAASADARSLAVGCDDGSVVIVDIAGGPGVMEHSLICQRQESRVLSVCWAGEVVVGGCADARIRCWQVRPAADATSGLAEGRGRLVATMRVDKSKTESTLVWSVQALPRRHQIVSGDSTGSIKFWDLRHYSLLQSFAVHDADVLCAVHDAGETRVFSAGVDRKIHQFQLVTSASSRISKWVHANSRLLHANDVRAMAVYEARGASVLASGGVERSVVLVSVSHFVDGRYRKLAATQRAPVEVSASGLVALWHDQTVKVWRVADDYRLVAKLSLSSDENVVQASVNAAGSMVAVATVGAVKVFGLAGTDKLRVSKVRDGALEALGAKRVAWARDALVVLTPDDEVYLWDGRVRLVATVGGATALAVSPDSQHAAIARLDGTIEVVPLAAGAAPFVLTRTSVQCMAFTAANTLAVVGADNKFHEFSLDGALLTAWSRRNSEFLPKQFLQLDERPQGMFAEGSRMWVYGANWMAFFDLAENIPINKAHQNTAAAPRKRHRDGLQIEPDDGGDDDDDGVEIVELRQSQVDRLRQQIAADGAAPTAARAFWMTTKYRPILAAGPLAGGVIVVEMPSVSATPAFNLPKFRI